MTMSMHANSAAGGVSDSPRAVAPAGLCDRDRVSLDGPAADLPHDADAASPFARLVAFSKRHARLAERLEARAGDLRAARRAAADPLVRKDVALANLDRRRVRYHAALVEIRAARLEARAFLGSLPEIVG